MKIIVGFLRIFVGILFIISGLIKLNDPVGFSFKLGDYFAPDVLNLEALVPFALGIAIVVVIYEVLLGVMLIIGYAKKFTLWSLLLMIIGFTFLTFYSAYFNKVTDCGCFGDALPLVPWESFYKDVALLAMILVLFAGRKYLYPFFSKMVSSIIVLITFILCLWFGYHVLMHLPAKDYRAYKIGNSIQEGMSIPEDAPAPVVRYNWEYTVNGENTTISNTTGQDPKPEGGTFVGVTTEFEVEPYEPPIHDFTMEKDGVDYQNELLETENLIVVIAYSLDITETEGYANIREITNKAIKNGYKVIGMSASSEQETKKLTEDYDLNFDFYFCDMTTLKTIVRSNPGILELDKGTIKQKLHWNDALEMQLEALPNALPNLDFGLKKRLDSIAVLDQKYRTLLHIQDETARIEKAKELGISGDMSKDALWEMQTVIDATNMEFVAQVFNSNGYPGKSVVGEPSNEAAWFVLQHNPDKIETYLPIIRKAGETGELSFRLVAMMEDRYLMGQNKPQIYGTQGSTRNGKQFIWPIKDPESINERRAQVGYTQTIEEYSKILFGEDFEYKILKIDDVIN